MIVERLDEILKQPNTPRQSSFNSTSAGTPPNHGRPTMQQLTRMDSLDEFSSLCSPPIQKYVGGQGVAFFGVYDGHAGYAAADYARTQLHMNVGKHAMFPDDLFTAIRDGVSKTDEDYCAKSRREGMYDNASSSQV